MRTHFHGSGRSRLELMGIRFADAGGDGAGAGGDGGNDSGGSGGDQSQQQPKPYAAPASQEELDRIIESRLARERARFADYDDLKAAKTELEELRESQKSADEKAIDAARSEATTEVTQRFLSRLVTTEAKSIAATLGFIDPSDALQVIDPQKLPVKDDEPDADAIKTALEELAKAKTYLLRQDAPKVRTRPKPAAGEPSDGDKTPNGGKGKAAAALRQLAASRKGS